MRNLFLRSLVLGFLRVSAFALAPIFGLGTLVQADIPGNHPAYLHALTDLRAARSHLQKRGGSSALRQSDQQAIAYINNCIAVVKQAGSSDGKPMAHDKSREDAGHDAVGDLHRAFQLLQKVRQDISKPESNSAVTALQTQALQFLDQAIQQVQQSLNIKQ